MIRINKQFGILTDARDIKTNGMQPETNYKHFCAEGTIQFSKNDTTQLSSLFQPVGRNLQWAHFINIYFYINFAVNIKE